MMNRKIWWSFLLGGSLMLASAQEATSPFDRPTLAREAKVLQSPVGIWQALKPIYQDSWRLEAQDEEARYLDALAQSLLGSGTAELKLLHFIEEKPHSRYIHHAKARMGTLYYQKGQYGNALYWLRQVDFAQLPEEMEIMASYYYAYALMVEGDTKQAVQLFEPLAYAFSVGYDASFYAGYLLTTLGEWDRAKQYLQRVQGHQTYGTYARTYLAEIELVQKQYNNALSQATHLLEEPRLPEVLQPSLTRTAGMAAAQLGQILTATQYLEKHMHLVGMEAAGRVEQLTLGKCLLDLERYQDALPYLQAAGRQEQDFTSQLALYYLGLCQLSLKESDAAIISFDRATAIATFPPVTEVSAYNAALATYTQSAGKVGAGSKRLRVFLTTYPESSYRDDVLKHLGEALLHEPNATVAMAELQSITPLPSELTKIRERLRLRVANQSLKSGDASKAHQQYDAIIKAGVDPQSVAEAYLWKGEAAYRGGDYLEAVRSTQKYLEERPSSLPLNVNAYYTIGYAQYNLGNYAEAERYFTQYKALNQHPTPDERTAILNRLGDIKLQQKLYGAAFDFYRQAELAAGEEADYACFRQGMVKGLERDYTAKANILGNLSNRYPQSRLIPEALYEQGRSLGLKGDARGAQQVFVHFLEQYSRDPFAPKVGIQLALSYFGEKELGKAAAAYEQVIRNYPRTPEATSAIQGLKGISVQLNKVGDFDRLLAEVGAGSVVSYQEIDSLTYLAAERLLGEGDRRRAAAALEEYLQKYPQGAFVDKAGYQQALLAYNAKEYTKAIQVAQPIAQQATGEVQKDLYKLLAASYDQLKEEGRAAEAYLSLARITSSLAERSKWVFAASERAFRSKSKAFLQALAEDIVANRIVVNDATKARVFADFAETLALQSDFTHALPYAERVLALPSGGKHAMASVVKGQVLYNQGQAKEAEKLITKLVEQGSSDSYWMARAFILLADLYKQKGDKESAKLYLESVQSNYPNHSDGIMDLINGRLAQL